jgi:hypothetical protein
MYRSIVVGGIMLGMLGGCRANEEQRVAKLQEANPTPARFSICHGNSCRLRTDVSLSTEEWAQVGALFDPAPADALAERRQIARAIGLLETFSGRRADTLEDAPGMGVHWNPDGQLDCIDEATNSTTYLRMMAADRLIRVGAEQYRDDQGDGEREDLCGRVVLSLQRRSGLRSAARRLDRWLGA